MKKYDYKTLAKYYDLIELEEYNPKYQNAFLSKFFKEKGVKTILDATCGTGAQTIYLKQQGFDITGNDICKEMLDVAKEKATANNLDILFFNLDLRTGVFGKYDAVIALFNSIGHLSKTEFEKALHNIYDNLNDNGLFIFDIYNYDFFKGEGLKIKHRLDSCLKKEEYKVIRFSYNKLNRAKRILYLRQNIYIQQEGSKLQRFRNNWKMRIYNKEEIQSILKKVNFKLLGFYDKYGCEFINNKSYTLLTILQKK